MRIIFLGTPQFAVPTLQALIDYESTDVVAVVCQPDRPAGRGNKLHEPAVKTLAKAYKIPVFQPERLSKSSQTVEELRTLTPDLLVMVAFGQILKKPVLELAKLGVINIHASLLPLYRGAAPINWAIINGATRTGVTTMYTDEGMDTGPILLKKEVDIGPDTTSEQLSCELSAAGAKLLIQTIKELQTGTLKPQPQDESKATYAPLLTKDLGIIDWTKGAKEIHNLVRGLQPWPGTSTTIGGSVIKISKTRLENDVKSNGATTPGSIVRKGDKVFVSCGLSGQQLIELVEVQPANRSKIHARDWANGLRLNTNEAFGSSNAC
jgi:methionyl-tRNA formyltransferase